MISIEKDIEETHKYFKDSPALAKNGNRYILEGILHCGVKGYEDLYDVFSVRIVVPFNFPVSLPIIIEKEGKIPRDADHHIDKDGKCCLGTNVALYDYIHCNKIRGFCQYLEQIIIMHFFQIKHFMAKGQWLEKPEAHFTEGLIDSYARIFDLTKDELKKKLSLRFKRYDKCLCKSNRRFDKCHGRYIPVEQVHKDFKEIITYFQRR